MHITFRTVDTSEIGRAHEWHREFASANDAIYPRSKEQFLQLALDRYVWCAVSTDDEYLAMSYANYDDVKNEWEIGGLMVADKMRGKGLGTIMMRVPLAHMLFNEQPLTWTLPPKIVAHVLTGNDAPRKIIPEVGFAFAEHVTIPPEALPGLRVSDDGMIHGDEFHFEIPDGLTSLADWTAGWNDTLKDGTRAEIDLLEGNTLDDWTVAIRDMAART